jgi:hypothetical protein
MHGKFNEMRSFIEQAAIDILASRPRSSFGTWLPNNLLGPQRDRAPAWDNEKTIYVRI